MLKFPCFVPVSYTHLGTMSKEIKFDFLLNKYINKEIENVYEQYKKLSLIHILLHIG